MKNRIGRISSLIVSLLALAILAAPRPAGAAVCTKTSTGTATWNTAGTWTPSGVPGLGDVVCILTTHTVTLNASPVTVAELKVTGTLNMNSMAYLSRTMTVTGPLSINSGGSITLNHASGANTHTLKIGGDLANHGTFTATNGDDVINVTFNGNNALQTINGSSATAFNTITVDKGTSRSNILDVQSTITMASGGLTLTNGTFKLSSASTITPFSGTRTIGSTAGLMLNNAGATLNWGSSGSLNLTGAITITNGTMNIGSASENSLIYGTGSSFTMHGGAVNITGGFNGSGTNQTIAFIMSGGTLTAMTLGGSASSGAFDISAAGSLFTMSNGTIVLQTENTNVAPIDYRNIASTVNISGGTVQFGSASTAGSPSFVVSGVSVFPSLNINATGTPSVQLNGGTTVQGNVSIGTGTSLNANGQSLTISGNSTSPGDFTNSGTFTSGNQTTNFTGSTAQTISGSSATTFNGLTISNSNGVSLGGVDATVNAILTLTSGDLNTGANKLTMGSAATTVSTANDVVGNVLRNTPGTGATALSYGSQWTTIKFDTTAPVSMTVSLTKPITAPFQDAVKRQYTLTPSSPLTNTATIQLHVNASDETEKNEQAVNSLNLYRFTGSTWAFVGATLRSTSAGVPGTSPSSWVSKTGVTTFSPWGIGGISSPTTVRLSKFEARVADNEVALNWTTGSETNAAGFNIYRSESWDGPYACLNAQLIPTAANSIAGGSYRYEDPTVVPGRTYFYQLEDVELNGASVRHSPVTVFVGDTRATVAVPWLEILGVTGLATLMACWIFLGIKKRS